MSVKANPLPLFMAEARSPLFMSTVLSSAITFSELALDIVSLKSLLDIVQSIPSGKTRKDIQQELEKGGYFVDPISSKSMEKIVALREEYTEANLDAYNKAMDARGAAIDTYLAIESEAIPQIDARVKAGDFLTLEYALLEKDSRIMCDLAFSGFVFLAQQDKNFSALCKSPDQPIDTFEARMNAPLDAEKLKAYFQQKTDEIGAFVKD